MIIGAFGVGLLWHNECHRKGVNKEFKRRIKAIEIVAGENPAIHFWFSYALKWKSTEVKAHRKSAYNAAILEPIEESEEPGKISAAEGPAGINRYVEFGN